jgi:hypothetical protein
VTVENVVTKDERNAVATNKLPTDQERLGNSFGAWLHGVGQSHSPTAPVPEKIAKSRDVVWGGDH